MVEMMDAVYTVKAAKFMAAGLCMAIGGIGPALGQGYIGGKICESISKSPDTAKMIADKGMLSMLIVETSSVFSFVIAVMLLFFV